MVGDGPVVVRAREVPRRSPRATTKVVGEIAVQDAMLTVLTDLKRQTKIWMNNKQGWGEHYSGTRLAQNDKHDYTKNIVLKHYSSTDFPVLVLVCSVLAPVLITSINPYCKDNCISSYLLWYEYALTYSSYLTLSKGRRCKNDICLRKIHNKFENNTTPVPDITLYSPIEYQCPK